MSKMELEFKLSFEPDVLIMNVLIENIYTNFPMMDNWASPTGQTLNDSWANKTQNKTSLNVRFTIHTDNKHPSYNRNESDTIRIRSAKKKIWRRNMRRYDNVDDETVNPLNSYHIANIWLHQNLSESAGRDKIM